MARAVLYYNNEMRRAGGNESWATEHFLGGSEIRCVITANVFCVVFHIVFEVKPQVFNAREHRSRSNKCVVIFRLFEQIDWIDWIDRIDRIDRINRINRIDWIDWIDWIIELMSIRNTWVKTHLSKKNSTLVQLLFAINRLSTKPMFISSYVFTLHCSKISIKGHSSMCLITVSIVDHTW